MTVDGRPEAPDLGPMNPPFRYRAVVRAGAIALVISACASERQATTAPPFGEGSTTTTAAVSTPPPTAPAIRSLAMVGDSITLGTETELRERLASLGVEIRAIDAEDGRRMTPDGDGVSGVEAVAALASSATPDLWVIALGTNDVGLYNGAEFYAPIITEMIDAVPDGAPLVWVDVYVESIPDRSAEFNAALRDALEARGQATVVDWASLAAEDGVLRDGIHPSGYGIEQFAEMVTAAVGQWVG